MVYEDIRGTSATKVAMKFDCSSKKPCTKIKLHNVNLTYASEAAQSSCSNVLGTTTGIVQPNGCLELGADRRINLTLLYVHNCFIGQNVHIILYF